MLLKNMTRLIECLLLAVTVLALLSIAYLIHDIGNEAKRHNLVREAYYENETMLNNLLLREYAEDN